MLTIYRRSTSLLLLVLALCLSGGVILAQDTPPTDKPDIPNRSMLVMQGGADAVRGRRR
ncbi:MAG: hypothetical protein R2873_03325 [Caldilineaceae bacterium]